MDEPDVQVRRANDKLALVISVLSLFSILFGGGMAYQRLQSGQDIVTLKIDNLRDGTTSRITDLERRVNRVEAKQDNR